VGGKGMLFLISKNKNNKGFVKYLNSTKDADINTIEVHNNHKIKVTIFYPFASKK